MTGRDEARQRLAGCETDFVLALLPYWILRTCNRPPHSARSIHCAPQCAYAQ